MDLITTAYQCQDTVVTQSLLSDHHASEVPTVISDALKELGDALGGQAQIIQTTSDNRPDPGLVQFSISSATTTSGLVRFVSDLSNTLWTCLEPGPLESCPAQLQQIIDWDLAASQREIPKFADIDFQPPHGCHHRISTNDVSTIICPNANPNETQVLRFQTTPTPQALDSTEISRLSVLALQEIQTTWDVSIQTTGTTAQCELQNNLIANHCQELIISGGARENQRTTGILVLMSNENALHTAMCIGDANDPLCAMLIKTTTPSDSR